MADNRSILHGQGELFRQLLDLGHGGMPIKVLAARLDCSESAVRHYRDGINAVSLAVVWKLAGVASAEQLGLLLPDGLALVRVPDGADHGEFAAACLDFAGTYSAARHEGSEAGSAIGPGEDAVLHLRAAAVVGAKK